MFFKSEGDPAADPPIDLEKQFKSLRVAFESDGTAEGTKLQVNGQAVGEMAGFTLSASPLGDRMNLYCSYTQGARGDSSDGFKPVYTYTLAKSLGVGEDGPDVDIEKVLRHEGGKWVLYTRDGKKKLGTFDTKDEALAQERAIYANKHKRLDPGDLENVQAYMGDLPPQLRRSVENLIGAVQVMDEPIEKEEGQTVPDPTNQDGVVKPAAAGVDLSGVMDALKQVTGVVASLNDKVSAMEAADKARRDAVDRATADAAAHEAAVAAGEEVKFDSEDDALATIAAEANQEAIAEAETGK